MLVLFYTEGCHLCDDSCSLLRQLHQSDGLQRYNLIDIAANDDLMKTYSLRIPIVRIDNRELGWPFDYNDLQSFISLHQD